MNGTNRTGIDEEEEILSDPSARQNLAKEIRTMQRRSTRGMWNLALFLLISLGSLDGFRFLPSFSPSFRATLGAAPPTYMISGALVIYSFAAVVLVLSRMTSGTLEYSGIAHVGYLCGFYTFYHLAGALAENVYAVLASGITVLSLEAFHVWNSSKERIRRNQELIERLNRLAAWREAEERSEPSV